jgi:hypothetical protein
MDAPRGNSYGHSADVRMTLSVNGDILPISHLGPDFLILRNSPEHGPADAEVFLSFVGDESRWMVRLVNGIHPDRLRTAIAPVRSESRQTSVQPDESVGR